MIIKFYEVDAQNIEILVDGATYGKLNFDPDRNIWILWPAGIDDGVSYFDNIEETKEAVKDEIIAFNKEN